MKFLTTEGEVFFRGGDRCEVSPLTSSCSGFSAAAAFGEDVASEAAVIGLSASMA